MHRLLTTRSKGTGDHGEYASLSTASQTNWACRRAPTPANVDAGIGGHLVAASRAGPRNKGDAMVRRGSDGRPGGGDAHRGHEAARVLRRGPRPPGPRPEPPPPPRPR